jgi:hypothetical protein
MAYHPLNDNFNSFFASINPSQTKTTAAAREHSRITELIEDRSGPAGELEVSCFLQGSYKQSTAIYDINDVDVVAQCLLWQPGSGNGGGRTWNRDAIFAAIADAIRREPRYASAVEYGPNSICVKVDSTVRVEVLPAVFKQGNFDPTVEPFRLSRPVVGWADGYARYHQQWLTWKNGSTETGGRFIPTVKVLKHIRSRFGRDAVSFHIECLLFSLASATYNGTPADYIASVLSSLANTDANAWYLKQVHTPCKDRDIFTSPEWALASWTNFHDIVKTLATLAQVAIRETNREAAIKTWQTILGEEYFPHL